MSIDGEIAVTGDRSKFLEIAVVVLSALVYAWTLSFQFVYDDIGQLVDNPSIRSWQFLPQYFNSHMWAGVLANSNYYRPLVLLWFRLNYVLFGLSPAGWHFTSIMAHAAATLLVLRLVYRLFANRTAAILSAMIFGLHPVHVQSVAWVSGVTDPVLAIFMTGSFLQYLIYRESRKPIRLAWSLLLYVGATLTKEPGVILPAMIFAYEYTRPAENPAHSAAVRRVKAATLTVLPFVLVTFAYLAVRMRALHGFAPALFQMGTPTMIRTLPSILWLNIEHLLLPWGYSLYYDFNPVQHFTDSQFLLPVGSLFALFVVLVGVCYLVRIPRNIVVVATIWFVLPLLPSLYLRAIPIAIFAQDRYLYISSIGFAILASNLILRVIDVVAEQRELPLLLYTSATIGMALASCTLIQQQYWESNIALYRRAVSVAPNNEQALANLAVALAEHKPIESLALFEKSLRLDPNSAKLNYLFGYTLYRIGQYSPSLSPLARAAELDPSMAEAFLYIGMSHLKLGYPHDAEAEITRSIVLEPHKRGAHLALGTVFEAEGNLSAAINETEIEARTYPDDKLVQQRLAELQHETR